MSNPSQNETFQKVGWPKVDAEKAQVKPAAAVSTDGFQMLSQTQAKKAAPSDDFISPYVSEDKLKEINAASRKARGDEGPDIEEIQRRAYQEGFAKGEGDGFKTGQQQARAQVEQMQHILSDISRAWEQIIATYERQILDLVCKVAERVVCGQVETDSDVVKRAILNAFSAIPEPVDVTIEVNPKDYEYIETIKEDFFEQIHSLKDVSVSADPSISRGGCKIRTRAGEVDATLQARLNEIHQSLMTANGHNYS